jgi:hypothetical protein
MRNVKPWPQIGATNQEFLASVLAELTVPESKRWLAYLRAMGVERFWYIEKSTQDWEIANA